MKFVQEQINKSTNKQINRIILATHNDHKTKEVKSILQDIGVDVVSLKDIGWTEEIIEDGLTFFENAEIKAKSVAAKYPLEYILSDDSGLVVNVLGGAPGVNSARYAGNDRSSAALCTKLLEETREVPFKQRNAYFITVLAYYNPTKKEVMFFEGKVEGNIVTEMIGSNGFGYDPVFFLPDKGKTMAQLSSEEKDSLSHRHNALAKFKQYLKEKNV